MLQRMREAIPGGSALRNDLLQDVSIARMPYRVPSLDPMDLVEVCYPLGPSSPELPLLKGVGHLGRRDREAHPAASLRLHRSLDQPGRRQLRPQAERTIELGARAGATNADCVAALAIGSANRAPITVSECRASWTDSTKLLFVSGSVEARSTRSPEPPAEPSGRSSGPTSSHRSTRCWGASSWSSSRSEPLRTRCSAGCSWRTPRSASSKSSEPSGPWIASLSS